MEHLVSFDTKAFTTELVSGDLQVSGYAVRWLTPDRESEMFLPGSLAKSIKSFLDGPAPLLHNHRSSAQIGRVTVLEERSDGVYFEGVVPEIPESSELRHLYTLLRRNFIAGVSIGGVFKRGAKSDGTQCIVSADIFEVSLSATPMDISTTATVTVVEPAGELVGAKALFMRDAARQLEIADMRLTVAELRLR